MRRIARLPRPSRSALSALAIALLIALLAEVPYLIADRQADRGWAFAGMMWCPWDYANFGAAMAEGASSSSWLIHNHTTQEPHPAILMYPFYVGLGKLAGRLGMSPESIFRVAAAVGRIALALSLLRLSRSVLSGIGGVGLGFVLAAFSGGPGALIAVAQGLGLLPRSGALYAANSGMYPELNTFLVLLTTPHLLIGLALAVELARQYYQSWGEAGGSSWAWLARGSLLGLALGLVNTFGVPAVLAPMWAHLGLATLWRRKVPARPAAVAVGTLAFGLPMPLYSLIVMRQDPIWTLTHSVQNLLPSPDLIHMIDGFGLLAILALVGLPRLLRQPQPRSLVLPVWCLTCLVLMYFPVAYQRRFGYGLQPMLAMMAAVGLGPILAGVSVRPSLAARLKPFAIRFVFLLLLFTGNMLLSD